MNTKEKIEVMQAWEDGKTIQYAYRVPIGKEEWHDLVDEPMWNWGNFIYRIKSEPLELWANVYKSGVIAVYESKEKAEQHYDTGVLGRKAVYFREVAEE